MSDVLRAEIIREARTVLATAGDGFELPRMVFVLAMALVYVGDRLAEPHVVDEVLPPVPSPGGGT